MIDLDHDPYLGLALRDRLESELPDLERLASASLTTGQKMRRRRRVAVGAGAAAAGIAVIALATSTLGAGGTTAREADVAGTPTAATSPAPGLMPGQVMDLGNGLTGTVRVDTIGLYELGASTASGPGSGFVVLVDGPTHLIEAWRIEGFGTLFEDWPGIAVATTIADADALGLLGLVSEPPMTVGTGWTCEWNLSTDTGTCTSTDGDLAGIVIHEAADRAAWLADTREGADSSVFTTEARNGIFISVQGGPGTTDAEIQELGESLDWVD